MFDLKSLYTGNLSWLTSNTILFGKAGSHSYGLNTASSDIDLKGVAIPPKDYFFGWMKKFEQAERKKSADDIEFVIYDIRKFFNLCADNNPNIVELLWLDPKDYLIMTSAGEKMIAAREAFLSKRARYSFAGYAMSQLKRIRSHRAWLLSPPKCEPTREMYGLPKDKALITKDQTGAMNELLEKGVVKESDLTPNFLEALAKEKAYLQARRYWEQYQEWIQSRNSARAELESKFGYDCKHASHLVRLLRMCREILVDHRVIVKRPDREELLFVRNGGWSYDQLIEWAEKQEKELSEIYEASTLRKEPDREYLDRLCVEIVETFLNV
jgi:predicted nucleotidyltransferase